MKVGINGFGRIGRSVFRILEQVEGIDVVAINDLFDYDALRYLLSYDTVMGPFSGNLKLEDDHFVTDKGRVRMYSGAIANARTVLDGDRPVDVVNPQVYEMGLRSAR